MALWFTCRVTSSRKSAQYGIRFSYPLYITLVALGTFLVNPYILSVTTVIAFLGLVLPMHPFDYIYNYVVTKLIGSNKIPGRGTESQVSSSLALLFNIAVIASILLEIRLNYDVMVLIYVLVSIFFIAVLLFRE